MADEAINASITEYRQVASALLASRRAAGAVLFSKNSLFAIGLRHLLEGAGFTVLGIVGDEVSLSLSCSNDSCGVTIIDGSIPITHVVAATRSLKSQCPQMRVAIIADAFDLEFVQQGLDAGVDGFCTSASDREVLIKSLELVMLGERILPTSLIQAMLATTPPQGAGAAGRPAQPKPFDPSAPKLSAREAEILTCLTQGAPNKLIARKLDVAEATVKVHIKAILRKIGAANRTQAAMWATEHMPVRGGASLSA